MSTPHRGRLLWRVYGFTASIVAIVIVSIVALPLLSRDAIWRRDAALIDALATEVEARFPDRAAARVHLAEVHELAMRNLEVYAPDGRPLDSGEVDRLSATGLKARAGDPVIADGRVIVAVGAPPKLLFSVDAVRPPLPVVPMVLMLCAMLSLTTLGAVWFTRSIARPLVVLGGAARAFGRGDLQARANVARRDELGEVGRSFDEMADQIVALLKAQRSMMADISHELRTPLTRVKIALELAADDPVAAANALSEVGGDLEEIEQIIEDVFDLVRLDQRRESDRRLRVAAVPVAHVVERAASRFRAHHGTRTLLVDAPDDQIIEVDPILLRRALDNLLDNAAKYSAPDSSISLCGRAGRALFTFEIIDRGMGMSTEELALAFTPFWRADESRDRTTGGVGLGLALARRIARAHGGDIQLESRRGAGTCARLTIAMTAGGDQ